MRKCTDLSELGPLVTSGPDDACKSGNTFNRLFRYFKKFKNCITGYLTIHSTYL